MADRADVCVPHEALASTASLLHLMSSRPESCWMMLRLACSTAHNRKVRAAIPEAFAGVIALADAGGLEARATQPRARDVHSAGLLLLLIVRPASRVVVRAAILEVGTCIVALARLVLHEAASASQSGATVRHWCRRGCSLPCRLRKALQEGVFLLEGVEGDLVRGTRRGVLKAIDLAEQLEVVQLLYPKVP